MQEKLFKYKRNFEQVKLLSHTSSFIFSMTEEQDYVPRFLPGTYMHIPSEFSIELDFARYKLIVRNGEFVEGRTKSNGHYLEVERLTGEKAIRRLFFEIIVDYINLIGVLDGDGNLIAITNKPFGVIWEYGPRLYMNAEAYKAARDRKNKQEGY